MARWYDIFIFVGAPLVGRYNLVAGEIFFTSQRDWIISGADNIVGQWSFSASLGLVILAAIQDRFLFDHIKLKFNDAWLKFKKVNYTDKKSVRDRRNVPNKP